MDNTQNASDYIELSLQEVGREVCLPDKVFSFTPKKYHLFHYVGTGRGTLKYGGIEYEIHAGQLFYIAPGDHPIYTPDPEDPWSYVWLGFDGSNAERFLTLSGISKTNPVFTDNGRVLKPYFEAIENEKRAKDGFDLVALGYAYQLFGKLLEAGPSFNGDIGVKTRHVETAKEFIINNYAFDVTVEDIAKNVGVSPNYLANIFKDVEGSSPKKYLSQVRMEKAASLLKTGHYKIKDIAKMVSFKNQLHFSNSFKKYYGISPRDYEKASSRRHA